MRPLSFVGGCGTTGRFHGEMSALFGAGVRSDPCCAPLQCTRLWRRWTMLCREGMRCCCTARCRTLR